MVHKPRVNGLTVSRAKLGGDRGWVVAEHSVCVAKNRNVALFMQVGILRRHNKLLVYVLWVDAWQCTSLDDVRIFLSVDMPVGFANYFLVSATKVVEINIAWEDRAIKAVYGLLSRGLIARLSPPRVSRRKNLEHLALVDFGLV